MFQGLFIAIILIPLLIIVERNKDKKMHIWEMLVISVVPGIVVWGLGLLIMMIKLSIWFVLLSYTAYIFIPYFIMTEQYNFKSKEAAIYTAYVSLSFVILSVMYWLAMVLISRTMNDA